MSKVHFSLFSHHSSTIVGVASERMKKNERSRGRDSSRNLDFVHTERIVPIPTGTDGTPLAGGPPATETPQSHATHQAALPARDGKAPTSHQSEGHSTQPAASTGNEVEPTEAVVEVSGTVFMSPPLQGVVVL